MDAAGRRLNITPARMLRLAEHYGIKTGQRGGQRFARYPSGACLLQFSLEGERHYLHLGTAGERVLLSHEWTERDETRRIKSRYDVIPIPHELLRELDMLMAGVPALSAAADIPDCFKAMGFERLPEDADSVKAKYRELAKNAHPDAGGDEEAFLLLRANLNKCLTWFAENGRAG